MTKQSPLSLDLYMFDSVSYLMYQLQKVKKLMNLNKKKMLMCYILLSFYDCVLNLSCKSEKSFQLSYNL